MTAKLRFVLSGSLSVAAMLGIGACGAPTTERIQAGFVPRPEPVDLERGIGDTAELAGAEATVTAVEWRRALTDTEDGGFLIVDVVVRNSGDEPMSYSSLDWSLLLPDGTMAAPTVTTLAHLRSGELLPGKGVEGPVVFELARPDVAAQVVYQPAAASASRVRWRADKPMCATGATSGRAIGSCPIASG